MTEPGSSTTIGVTVESTTPTVAPPLSLLRSAISDSDGWVDAGYLGFVWVMFAIVGTVPLVLGALLLQQAFDPAHKFDAVGFGQFLTLASAAFGVAAGCVGAFRRLDRQKKVELLT